MELHFYFVWLACRVSGMTIMHLNKIEDKEEGGEGGGG